jgi:hypothetical protein
LQFQSTDMSLVQGLESGSFSGIHRESPQWKIPRAGMKSRGLRRYTQKAGISPRLSRGNQEAKEVFPRNLFRLPRERLGSTLVRAELGPLYSSGLRFLLVCLWFRF